MRTLPKSKQELHDWMMQEILSIKIISLKSVETRVSDCTGTARFSDPVASTAHCWKPHRGWDEGDRGTVHRGTLLEDLLKGLIGRLTHACSGWSMISLYLFPSLRIWITQQSSVPRVLSRADFWSYTGWDDADCPVLGRGGWMWSPIDNYDR